MKKSLFILAALCCTMLLNAQAAYDFSEPVSSGQTLFFKILDAEAHTVAVCTEKGNMYPYYEVGNEPAGELVIPGTITHDAVEYSIVKIDNDAFRECGELTSVTFSENLKVIGKRAFHECAKLAGELNFPNSLDSIGENAFRPNDGWGKITAINFGSGLKYVGSYAFTYQHKIKKLVLPNSLQLIDSYGFENMKGLDTLIIGTGIKYIAYQAFYECTSLRYVEIHATTPPVCWWAGNPAYDVTAGRVFGNNTICNKIAFLVPEESRDTYATKYLFSGTRLYNLGDKPVSELRFTAPEDLLPIIGQPVSVASSVEPRHIGDENEIVASEGAVIEQTYWTDPYGGVLADGTVVAAGPEDGRKYSLWVFYSLAEGYYPTFEAQVILNDKAVEFTTVASEQFVSCGYAPQAPLAVGDTIKVKHADPDYTLFYKVTSTTEGSRKVTLVAEKEDYNAHNYTTPISGDVVVPATVTAQGNEYTVTELGTTAFYKQTGITSLTLPNTIVTVEAYALGALNLTEIALPNSVKTLQNQFIGNGQTTTIHIPASVTNITSEAFSNAKMLATITCDAENTKYTVVDNILYNKDVTEALLVPCNNDQMHVIEFPETVTKLGYKLFYSDHACAQKIILPAGFNDLTGYFSTNKVDTVVFRCQDVPATSANTNFYNGRVMIVPCGKVDAWMADENIANAISKGAYHPTIEEQFLYSVTMGAVENGSIAIVEVEGAGCNEVTVEATPAEGFKLDSWSVSGVEADNRITLTVNADIEVTATFVSVPTALDNIRNQANISKRIVNGQLVIVREGKTYNMVGAEVK